MVVILERGVLSKADLRKQLEDTLECVIPANLLDRWINMAGLAHVFTRTRAYRLESQPPEPIHRRSALQDQLANYPPNQRPQSRLDGDLRFDNENLRRAAERIQGSLDAPSPPTDAGGEVAPPHPPQVPVEFLMNFPNPIPGEGQIAIAGTGGIRTE